MFERERIGGGAVVDEVGCPLSEQGEVASGKICKSVQDGGTCRVEASGAKDVDDCRA